MAIRTITLSDRCPVRIEEDDWPVIADAKDSYHDGQVESQANRKTSSLLRVRQHADGRALVYGLYNFSSKWQSEASMDVKHGVLLDTDHASVEEICAAIRAVAARMEESAGEPYGNICSWRQLADDCQADMPAERL